MACERLGLEPAPTSTQILQRDRHAELMTALAVLASSLDSFALEVRHLARTEVREVEEPFGRGQKGSSAMPHKRNPVVAERICGLARVVRGTALVALENQPLWHERDISHSSAERVAIPDAFLAVDYMLDRFAWLVEGLRVFPERMRRNLDASHGLFFSQRLLLALVEAGLARDEAYRLVQGHAMRAWEEERSFPDLVRADDAIAGARRPRRRLRPHRLHPSRRHGVRAPRRARPPGGARPCLKPRPTSPRGRSARSTRSTTERLLLVASDRISTFDVVLPTDIPDKGRVLTGLSAFWFARTSELVPNHLLQLRADGRSMECRRLEMLPIECVVRGYLTGSGWKDYLASGEVCGHRLPEGLVESQQLPEPIFTPATKAQTGHDENITREQAAELVGADLFAEAERVSLALYRYGADWAATRGIILADTKFELGLDPDGTLVLGDEALTPGLVALLAGRRLRGRTAASRRSTSSSCGTTASRWAGTRPRRGRSCRTTSWPGRGRDTSRRSSG